MADNRVSILIQAKDAAGKVLRGVESRLGGLQGVAIKVGAALAAAFAIDRLKAFAGEMFRLGTAAAETGSKFATTFGTASRQVQEFLDQWGTVAGLTKTVGQEFAATAGAIVQGMGASRGASADFSEQMLRLAGDLQSFHNVPIEETFTAIKAGLVGSWEPLDRFGIVLRQADVDQRALLNTGKKSAKQLTQLEKAQAALNLMYERAGPALGDLGRTKDSTANTARRLQAEFENVRIELATALLPAFEALLRNVEQHNLVERFSDAVKAFAANLDEVAAALVAIGKALLVGGAVAAVGQLALGIRAANAATVTFKTTIKGMYALMGPRGWFILGVAALAEAFRRSGSAAREAAREYKAALGAMDDAALSVRQNTALAGSAALTRAVARQKGQIEAQKAIIEGLEGGAEKAYAQGLLRQMETNLERLQKSAQATRAELRGLTDERLKRNAGVPSVVQDTPAVATPATGLSNEERKALERKLQELDKELEEWRKNTPWAGVEMLRPKNTRVRGPVDPETLPDAPGAVEPIAGVQGAAVGLFQTMREGANEAGAGMADAFAGAFDLMFRDIDNLGAGFDALWHGIGAGALGAVAQAAKAQAAEQMAKALAATAEGLGMVALGSPGAGAMFGSAAKHLAAATAFSALAGAGSMSASTFGNQSAGGAATGSHNFKDRQNQAAGATKGEATIVLEGGFAALLQDPDAQDSFAAMLENLSDRRVVVRRG